MGKYHLAALVGAGFVGIGITIFSVSAPALAQTFQIGDTAECAGQVGTIARIDPRPGWDEPFMVVEVRASTTTYEFKCTPSQLKAAPAQAPARAPAAQAQVFRIGDIAECSGYAGPIVRVDPRPGWDEPFYVVETVSSNVVYEWKCTPSQLKPAGGAAPAAPRAPAPQPAGPVPAPVAAAPAAAGNLCRPGAKIEGQWGISWYEVTVRGAPNQDGECPVSFDGYGREWDMPISMDQLRPRGGGDIYRPRNPVADTETDTAAGGAVPDGRYRCHKISPGGQLMDVGTLVMRGGQGTVIGMPEGWTTRSISVRGTDPRGKLLVAYDYRSEDGWNDRLDCVPQ